MAWGLDSIKEGLASLEKGITETARSATNTGGMKGTSLKKEKMKSWSKSKEGVALIDVALSLGLNATGSASKSVDTAEAFINDAHEKKDELMELGRKLVDKKSYEAGEKALDLQADVEKFVSDNVASFQKSIKDVMKKDSQAAARGRQANSKIEEKSFLDTLNEAKESSMKYTSKMVAGVSDKATEFKGEVAKTYGVSVEKVNELAASVKELPEKAGSFPERLMKSMEDKYSERKAEVQAEMFRMIDEGAAKSAARDAVKVAKPKTPNRDSLKSKAGMKVLLDGGGTAELTDAAARMTDKELAKAGIVRIPGYTTKAGNKVKEHYRKIGK